MVVPAMMSDHPAAVAGDASENGKVFGPVILAVPTAILAAGEVGHPVPPVPDGPLGAKHAGESLGQVTRSTGC
ncbi:MAG: hypothetical protein ACK4S2_15705 [Gemmobacter sp.]